MKQQITLKTYAQRVLTEEDVSIEYCYGVQWSIGERSFIQTNGYSYMGTDSSNPYTVLCTLSSFTIHNMYSEVSNNTLKGCVRACLRDGQAVYQFDTTKELFAWLAE